MPANRLPALAAAAALLLATGALRAQEARRGGANPIPHEPLLVYQLRGGTAGGGGLELLMVYDDGTATWMRQWDVGPAKVRRAAAGGRAAQLVGELARAGAMRLADLPQRDPDLPLATVTAFAYRRGSGRAEANTFSYCAAEGAYPPVEDAVRAFIADVFGIY